MTICVIKDFFFLAFAWPISQKMFPILTCWRRGCFGRVSPFFVCFCKPFLKFLFCPLAAFSLLLLLHNSFFLSRKKKETYLVAFSRKQWIFFSCKEFQVHLTFSFCSNSIFSWFFFFNQFLYFCWAFCSFSLSFSCLFCISFSSLLCLDSWLCVSWICTEKNAIISSF